MSEAENTVVEIDRAEPQLNVDQMVAEVMRRLSRRGVGKEQTNDYDKYKFRGIDDVYNALGPVLSSVGLVIYPKILSKVSEIKQGAKGNSLNYVNLEVEYRLKSSHDQSEETVVMVAEAMDRSDKATNKALSAAYKYMCFEVFCIPVDGQNSEAESPELGKNKSTTGRRAMPTAKIVADEINMDPNTLNEAIAGIRMSCFNEDKAGFFEIYDELESNDEKAKVYGNLDQNERAQCKVWLSERDASE